MKRITKLHTAKKSWLTFLGEIEIKHPRDSVEDGCLLLTFLTW